MVSTLRAFGAEYYNYVNFLWTEGVRGWAVQITYIGSVRLHWAVSEVVKYCLSKWDWSVAHHLCHDLWLHCVTCFRRDQVLSQQTRLICRSPPAPMITTSTWISSQCYLQSTQSWFVPLVCGQRDVKSCRTNLRRHIDQRVVDHTKHSCNLVQMLYSLYCQMHFENKTKIWNKIYC